ncbi:MAG: DUF362 domain-containing protein [Deltaproteobacteria bacterium]|nr:DUF362 domain-containing protein [Deltaproteobacteria bacterium]
MTDKNTAKINRRDAIKLTATSVAGATAAAALWVSPNAAAADPAMRTTGTGPGHVVKVHMPGMRIGAYPHPDAARNMVDRAVTELTGESSVKAAWHRFISPTDKIGIKINCLGTRWVSSMKEVVFAIVDSLRDAGVPNENMVIFDMFASNMMGGRYDQQPIAKKVRVLAHKDVGQYGDWVKAGPAKAKFTKLFLDCDSVINVPPIKDHDLAGVTCCMKNVTFGCVEKPHINHDVVNEAMAHLWALEEVRSRIKLNIIDGSTILYDGGPKANRRALVPHESIYATTDPVAMDTIAYELIENLRKQNGLRTLNEVKRGPHFLKMATNLGLGVGDRKDIRLQTVDLPKFVGNPA